MAGVTDTPDQLPRRVEYVRLDEVQLAPRNPKLHDDGIGKSISHHGFVEVPTKDERTGRLVAGHGRFKHLSRLMEAGSTPPDGVTVDDDGMWRMPLLAGWASRSDDDAEAYLVGSNQYVILGGWDEKVLLQVAHDLNAVDLLEVAGVQVEQYEALLEQHGNPYDWAQSGSKDGEAEPPRDFPSYDDDIATEYECPSCGYSWSGKPRPAGGSSDDTAPEDK